MTVHHEGIVDHYEWSSGDCYLSAHAVFDLWNHQQTDRLAFADASHAECTLSIVTEHQSDMTPIHWC